MDISERIKLIISHYKMTSAEFANKVAVQKSSVSHLLSGRNKPSFDFINKLAIAFEEINIEWFVTGKGHMLQSESGYDLDNSKNKSGSTHLTSAETISTSDLSDGKQNNSSENSADTDANSSPNSMILIFNDDTFKVLKSR